MHNRCVIPNYDHVVALGSQKLSKLFEGFLSQGLRYSESHSNK